MSPFEALALRELTRIADALEKLSACTDDKSGRTFFTDQPAGSVLNVDATINGSIETTDGDRIRE